MRAAVFLTAILFATRAAASDDQQTCANSKAPPSDRIIACSAVLDSTPMANAQMAETFLYRGIAYLAAGDDEAGMADASSAVMMNSDKRFASRAYLLRALAELRLGRLRAARDDSDLALAVEPDAPRAYLLRGMTEAQAGEHRAAELDFIAAIDHGLPGSNVWQRRSVERTALGDTAGAAADLAHAKMIDPHLSDASALP